MADYEELPTRSERVAGAYPVEFPWELAGSAVEALRAMADTLAWHWSGRYDLEPSIEGWQGPKRDEFDVVLRDLEFRSVPVAYDLGLLGTLRNRAQDMVDGANAANDEQSARNDEAEDLDPEERERREQEIVSRED